jgi:outer membrane immunogenic protein
MKTASFLALASLALASPALAGGLVAAEHDVVVTAPVVAVMDTFNWTGFYGGLSFGAGTASGNGGITEADTNPMGAHIGYLWDAGTFVLGGELAYVAGDFGDTYPLNEWASTRVKLIGGYDAGRLLPYGFVGMSQYDVTGGMSDFSDTVTIYGVGARYGFGNDGRFVVGLEYLVENKSDYDGVIDMENSDLSLFVDYRF